MLVNKKLIFVAVGCALVVISGAALAFSFFGTKTPSENRMAHIMADMYTADAIMQDYVLKGRTDKTPEMTYSSVLAHYGLSKEEYDAALDWYSQHSDRYSSVFDRVIAILSKRENLLKELTEGRDSIDNVIKFKNDSLKIFYGNFNKIVKLPISDSSDSLYKCLMPDAKDPHELSIDFELDSVQGGFFYLEEKYVIAKDNKVEASSFARISVLYADSTEDQVEDVLSIHKRTTQKSVQLTLNLKDSIQAVKLRVTPFACPQMDKAILNIRDIRVYYMPYVLEDTTHDFELPTLFDY